MTSMMYTPHIVRTRGLGRSLHLGASVIIAVSVATAGCGSGANDVAASDTGGHPRRDSGTPAMPDADRTDVGGTELDGGVVASEADAGNSVADSGNGVVDSGVTPREVPTGPIGANGGSMSLLHFAAFGDVRPPNDNDTSGYPTSVAQSVFRGIEGLGVPFAVGTGDYMFAATSTAVTAQLDLFQSAEANYTGYVFHCMGNHECNGRTASNCPNLNEYPNVTAFRSRLQADLPEVYHDFTVTTSLGDAHFILAAPNAWTSTQSTWLSNALNVTGPRYTFVFTHEPPNASGPPAGATEAEAIITRHTTTLRIYGHTHEYAHQTPNIVITGNAGAPLQHPGDHYGFVEVIQRADGNIVLNEYAIGDPATLSSSFVVTPTGTVTH